MKYHIWIVGCQYNEWDGAKIRSVFDNFGFEETSPKKADFIIILACAVRQTAVDRVFGKINNWQKIRPTTYHKRSTIIITGCVLNPDKKKLREKGVDIVKAGDYKRLIELIDKKHASKINLNDLRPATNYLPIMSGCNNFCSYCAVPYTRGREKSRPMKEILNDAKRLISHFRTLEYGSDKTIMLLGQNVNSYAVSEKLKAMPAGRQVKSEKQNKRDFTILLEKLNQLDGDFEISFVSNHPKDMSDDIIETVAKLPKIKKGIHLPLQSGSDKILKTMNRPYTRKQYLDIVRKIKIISVKYDVDIKLSTDVIVGFPGESEKDFQKAVEILKKVKFNYVFINKYSPRAGTKAYKLGDPIPWAEKQRRWRILNKITNK